MNFDTFYIKRFLLCIVLLAFTFKNSYLKISEIKKKKKESLQNLQTKLLYSELREILYHTFKILKKKNRNNLACNNTEKFVRGKF